MAKIIGTTKDAKVQAKLEFKETGGWRLVAKDCEHNPQCLGSHPSDKCEYCRPGKYQYNPDVKKQPMGIHPACLKPERKRREKS